MITFRSFDVITLRLGRSLDLREWEFVNSLRGFGEMKAKIVPHKSLRDTFVPDRHGVAVIDDGRVVWAGVLRGREWKRRQGQLGLSFDELKSLFYERCRAPELGDYIKQTEQRTIWSDLIFNGLMANATGGMPSKKTGFPIFAPLLPNNATGRVMQLTFRSFSSYGAAFDNMQARDGGLSWWTSYNVTDDQRTLQLFLNVGTRTTGTSVVAQSIRTSSDRAGGNIIDFNWPEDLTQNRTAVYALGEGQPPDVPWSYDEDPGVAAGTALRREVKETYGGVTNTSTLNSHARDERAFRSTMVSTMQITLPADRPDYRMYAPGDRVRLAIHDEWVDLDFPAVLITARSVQGEGGFATFVKMDLDLSNYDDPGEDKGEEVTN